MEDVAYYEQQDVLPTTDKGSLNLVFLTYSEVLVKDKGLTDSAKEYFSRKVNPAFYLKQGLKRLEIALGTYQDELGLTKLDGYVLNARDLEFTFFKYLAIDGHFQLKQHNTARREVVGMSFSLRSQRLSDDERHKANVLLMEAYFHLSSFPCVQIGGEHVNKCRKRLLHEQLKGTSAYNLSASAGRLINTPRISENVRRDAATPNPSG